MRGPMTFRNRLMAGLVIAGGGGVVQAGDAPRPVAARPADAPPGVAAADSDAPLPDGWPKATQPEAIEVKDYPAYRSAVARDTVASMDNQGKLFWPLFLHIQREGIAMTAPVVMQQEKPDPARPGKAAQGTMEFLYRHPDQGKVGPAAGTVKVEDRPAGRYVCIGLQGNVDEARMDAAVEKLRAWLRDHPAEGVEAGPPRRLGYHGPSTPPGRRLSEVQIPVKPASADAAK